MFCAQCGRAISPGDQFCAACGVSLAPTPAAPFVEMRGGAILDGRYRIEGKVGRGGFGRVYRATDLRFSATVAVKELLPSFADGAECAEFEQRFQQEAQVLFALKHPSLPKVTDYFSAEGRCFLVMEFVEGSSLRALMDARGCAAFGEFQVREWLERLCDIMEYLHSRTPPVIHRDIKPDNLIWNGEVKKLSLVDFGIIRLGAASRTSSYGTPGYASPEQASGIAHPAVDIFSAGATLHFLLTGKEPSESPFDFEPLAARTPPIDEALARTVDRMLALRWRERFQDIGELRRFISQAAPAPPPRPLTAASPAPVKLPAPAKPPAVQVSEAAPAPPPRPLTAASPGEIPDCVRFLHINRLGFEEYENTLDGAALVWIPGGEFPMGASSQDREAEKDERPAHTVRLGGFWMYRSPVTNGMFAKFLARSGVRGGLDFPDYLHRTGSFFPAAFVSWDDAQLYCAWVKAALPTEAQWEMAARGSDGRIFPWGDFSDPSRLNCWDTPGGAGRADLFDGRGPAPVGAFRGGASFCGCEDMCGNVWEWCRDVYHETFFARSGAVDPLNESPGPHRVLKGGAWNELPRNCRATKRHKAPPGTRAHDKGFRCIIEGQ